MILTSFTKTTVPVLAESGSDVSSRQIVSRVIVNLIRFGERADVCSGILSKGGANLVLLISRSVATTASQRVRRRSPHQQTLLSCVALAT